MGSVRCHRRALREARRGDQHEPDRRPVDATYDEVIEEINAFIGRLYEYHGLNSVVVLWSRSHPPEGARSCRGSIIECVGMARRFVVQQEALWKKEVTDEE